MIPGADRSDAAAGREDVNRCPGKREIASQEFVHCAPAFDTAGDNGAYMPAFGGKLSSADIADVASYVESMSQKGWS